MYISQLCLHGYKNTHMKSVINFNKGLNIIVGENGCGKTAVINALRFIFRERDSVYALSTDDFFCSHDKSKKNSSIEIDAYLSELNDDERITFLTWCNGDFNAHLHLQISENALKPGQVKRKWWGGESSASAFEDDVFDRIECVYLPPLRDAEARLSSGRHSRLATTIKRQYIDEESRDQLVKDITRFNDTIAQNEGGQHPEIINVKDAINRKVRESLGEELGQSINLQFSETSFDRIVEAIRMTFFPEVAESDVKKFRDLSTNSLGYNNLLFIATVLSELEIIKNTGIFTLLLIEEPEAHLHPQLQVRFIKYLEELSEKTSNAQIIITTHSPVLASSVMLNKLIHLSGEEESIHAATLSEKNFNDNTSEAFINRWLDVTKSTMLFSRGVILVEGIAECLVLPKLAELVIRKWNDEHPDKIDQIPDSLDKIGVSVININGIFFNYFFKLFGNIMGSTGPVIPIPCAGLTDRDPEKTAYPQIGEALKSNNPIANEVQTINNSNNEWIRLYMSPLKTFEYDLAIYNPATLAKAVKKCWPKEGAVKKTMDEIIVRYSQDSKKTNSVQLANDAQEIYKHIDDSNIGKGLFASVLSETIDDSFIVPNYIEEAVLWACGRRQL